MQRDTRQRRAIVKTVGEAGRPLGPQEILERAQRYVPRLGIATVYRTIRGLVESGTFRVVKLPGAADRYETAGKHHHHHFHCRDCDGVFELDSCTDDFRELAPSGFKLDHHEVTLYGLCPSCAV